MTWSHKELADKVADALHFAFVDAFMDDEVGIEDADDGGFPIIVQYSLDTNEPVARFEIATIGFRALPLTRSIPDE